jgi:polysaccharide export outer membrane protein
MRPRASLGVGKPVLRLVCAAVFTKELTMQTFLNAPNPAMQARPGSGFRILSIALMTAVLSGCLTGQRMSTSGGDNDAVVQGGDVRMVEITPQLVAANAGAAATNALPAELSGYRPDTYRIQPGDMLLVTVWDHPELTTPAGTMQQAATNGRLVYPDGTLFYPYAGTIKVEGMTIQELRSTLTSRLAKYLRNPQLDVNIANHGGQVSMEGAFTNSAPQSITTVPLTVSKAVGAAGINVRDADLSGLVLTRDGSSYTIDLDAMNRKGNTAGDIYLKPGDRLYLPFNDRKEVYVLGEVSRPQAITFKTSDMSLTQALGRAGGLDQVTSNGDAVYVIRGVDASQLTATAPSAATVYHLRAKSPAAFAVADAFSLKAGDVVFVGAAGITRWNRFLSQLLPLSGILRNAANVQNDVTN